MPKTGVYYRVYLYKKVKHQTDFYGQSVYPVYITVIHGRKSLNFKSILFSNLTRKKYQVSFRMNNCQPGMEDIIRQEQALVKSIIRKLDNHFSFELFKKEYAYYSTDLTHAADECCKHFLIHFFDLNIYPALKVLIAQSSDILTTDIILKDMQSILPGPVRVELFDRLMPYTGLFEFCKSPKQSNLPILTLFRFSEKAFIAELTEFLKSRQEAARTVQHIETLITNAVSLTPKKTGRIFL